MGPSRKSGALDGCLFGPECLCFFGRMRMQSPSDTLRLIISFHTHFLEQKADILSHVHLKCHDKKKNSNVFPVYKDINVVMPHQGSFIWRNCIRIHQRFIDSEFFTFQATRLWPSPSSSMRPMERSGSSECWTSSRAPPGSTTTPRAAAAKPEAST